MEKRRRSVINRTTGETEIKLTLDLDGGAASIDTGVPFLDHMLQLWAKHGEFGLEINARGDVQVDYHHTVEDTGICLGKALDECLGDKKGISRYGHAITPMDEALVLTAVDISGRGFLALAADFPSPRVGGFDTELVEEFLRALASSGQITLHVQKLAGRNSHHIIEAMFKGLGRTLRQAVAPGKPGSIPSTKGLL